MSAAEWQAISIERTAHRVAHWVEQTSPERFHWTPAGLDGETGRSVSDMAWEVIVLNFALAKVLAGEQPPWPPEEPAGNNSASVGETAAALRESARAAAASVRNLGMDDLEKTFSLGQRSMPGAMLCSLIHNHIMYHGGQICYIQTLYGDKTFSFPPEEFT